MGLHAHRIDDATISSVINQFVFDPMRQQPYILLCDDGDFKDEERWRKLTKRMEGMKEVLMVATLGMDPTRPAILCRHQRRRLQTVNEGGHWERSITDLVPPE